MLQPKRTKFRKSKRGASKGVAKGGTQLNFGVLRISRRRSRRAITARQIEAARRAMTRSHEACRARVWIRVFPDVPVSKKPTEVRMGKGKGTPEFWAAKRQARAGSCSRSMASATPLQREALRPGAAKLPVKTRVVVRRPGEH